MSNQKRINLQYKIEREAVDGVNRVIANEVANSNFSCAKAIAEVRIQIADNVVARLQDHFSIQVKQRRT